MTFELFKQTLWNAPAWIDRWRIWPRAMITTYIYITLSVTFWFMGLPTPTPEQAAFASAVLGVGAAWFGLYIREPAKHLESIKDEQSQPEEATKG